ncbi:MAG: alpha-L-arabinofuranosidase C-terminal domain-containing protein, partial [Armatimonadota bacterium]
PAWQGIESNDVGLHEFLDLCQLLKTEPLIVVNTGFGDAHSAAEEVEYVNGGTSTPNGALRARNGRREPWKVRWWGVGNEMWGPWQLGYMALDQYVVKHNLVESAMRKVDPTIKTVSSGDLGGGWTERMLRDASATTTLISEHFYCQERPGTMGHIRAVPEAIRAKADAHRRLRETIPGLKQKKIKIAMDEWNYWYGPHLYGELGTRYYWKDGLGIAAGLHEYFRQTDIIGMANYAQTVNVIGAIKTTPTDAWMETTGLVLSLYRRWFGTKPLRVEGASDPLDVVAALTEDGTTMTVAVINPAGSERTLRLSVPGVAVAGPGERFRIAHPDPQAFNDARARPITVERSRTEAPWTAPIAVPGLSVTLWRFPVKGLSR